MYYHANLGFFFGFFGLGLYAMLHPWPEWLLKFDHSHLQNFWRMSYFIPIIVLPFHDERLNTGLLHIDGVFDCYINSFENVQMSIERSLQWHTSPMPSNIWYNAMQGVQWGSPLTKKWHICELISPSPDEMKNTKRVSMATTFYL